MRTINREEIVTNSGHVVVLKGGNSAEREISLLSGDAVFQSLQRLGVSSSVIDVDENIMARLLETSNCNKMLMSNIPNTKEKPWNHGNYNSQHKSI